MLSDSFMPQIDRQTQRENLFHKIDSLLLAVLETRSQINQLAGTARLPNELLMRIFEFYVRSQYKAVSNGGGVHPYQAFRIAHVCRHWRQVAFQCSALWSQITLPPANDMAREANDYVLHLSKSSPLYININMPYEPDSRFTDVAHRIKALSVSLERYDDVFWDIFTVNLPILDTISLSFGRPNEAPAIMETEADTCLNQFPYLKTLDIANFSFCTLLRFARPTITSLSLEYPLLRDFTTYETNYQEKLFQLLSSMPLLEDLDLRHCIGSEIQATNTPPLNNTSFRTLGLADRVDRLARFFTILQRFSLTLRSVIIRLFRIPLGDSISLENASLELSQQLARCMKTCATPDCEGIRIDSLALVIVADNRKGHGSQPDHILHSIGLKGDRCRRCHSQSEQSKTLLSRDPFRLRFSLINFQLQLRYMKDILSHLPLQFVKTIYMAVPSTPWTPDFSKLEEFALNTCQFDGFYLHRWKESILVSWMIRLMELEQNSQEDPQSSPLEQSSQQQRQESQQQQYPHKYPPYKHLKDIAVEDFVFDVIGSQPTFEEFKERALSEEEEANDANSISLPRMLYLWNDTYGGRFIFKICGGYRVRYSKGNVVLL
ncbi:hypothetical protein C8Q75DRAFT_490753 [Abortiporus biennis]|nr:hypothetical protein C8Q75DRAFT_490753 [Abortiporus biennis]